MLFEFQKYIQPFWYFNKSSKGDTPYWVDYQKLPADDMGMLDVCKHYRDSYSEKADAAFQLFQAGCIMHNKEMALQQNKVVDVIDNYVFVARFFSRYWLLYVLFIRLFSFKNPFHEIRGCFKAWTVKKYHANLGYFNRDFSGFHSNLLDESPLVSVVIPTLNRYQYLDAVLNDLEKQTYKNFEVIVCDQSEPVQKDFYLGRNLRIKLIEQKEKALWLARNESIKVARGEFIALSDDDMRIKPDWLIQHLKCIDFFNADISAGTFIPFEGSIPETDYTGFGWASHFSTNNVLLKKEVFRKVGLFDRQFEKQRMGDGAFGMRCYLNGLTSVSNEAAVSFDIKAPVGGLRQMGSWDSIRPTKVFAPRPVPSVLYYGRQNFGSRFGWYYLLMVFPKMAIPYRYRNHRRLYPLGLLLGMAFSPVLLVQMFISWRQSTKMIKNGPKIESL